LPLIFPKAPTDESAAYCHRQIDDKKDHCWHCFRSLHTMDILEWGISASRFLAALTFLGQWEFFRMLKDELSIYHHLIGYGAGLAIIADTAFFNSGQAHGIVISALILYFVIEIMNGKEHKLKNITTALLVTLYPAAFIVYLYMIFLYPGALLGLIIEFSCSICLLLSGFLTLYHIFQDVFGAVILFSLQFHQKKRWKGFRRMAGVILFGIITSIITGYSFPE